MKLSFSFAKAAPKRPAAQVQPAPQSDDNKREVLAVSDNSEVLVEKTAADIEAEKNRTLIIPCKSFRSHPRSDVSEPLEPKLSDGSLVGLESVGGLIACQGSVSPRNVGIKLPHLLLQSEPKKMKPSVLMQVRDARKSGLIQDAPDQEKRSYDADDFGWALLRGMGYDPGTDKSVDVTKDVVGNRTKRGLGVRPADLIALPTDVASSPEQ